MPSSQALLDAGTYPHILQLVVDHASHEALISLRATCRALRTRADMLLNAGRLIVTQADLDHVPRKGKQPRVIVSSEGGRLPAFAAWALGPPAPPRVEGEHGVPNSSLDEGSGTADVPPQGAAAKIDSKSVTAPPANAKDAGGMSTGVPRTVVSFPPHPQNDCMPYRAVADLRYTTAIDLVGPVAGEYARRLIESKPFRGGPSYVRVFDHDGQDVYTQSEPPPDLSRKCERQWRANMTGMNAVKFTTLPRFLAGRRNNDRLDPKADWDEVVHIAYHPEDTLTVYGPPTLGNLLYGVRSLTYVLHRAATPCTIAVPKDKSYNKTLNTYESPVLLDMLFGRAAVNELGGVRVTIVNIDVLAGSRWFKDLDLDDTSTQFRLKCAELARSRIGLHSITLSRAQRLFEFKTMDEFRSGLPASRDAALETTREGRL